MKETEKQEAHCACATTSQDFCFEINSVALKYNNNERIFLSNQNAKKTNVCVVYQLRI